MIAGRAEGRSVVPAARGWATRGPLALWVLLAGISAGPGTCGGQQGGQAPPEQARAASRLEAEVRCDQARLRVGIAELRWEVARQPGSEQQVVVTNYRDGFETGKFKGSKKLPPKQASFVWEGLEPGMTYNWRVLTKHGKGWVPSATATFEGPTCVADYVK